MDDIIFAMAMSPDRSEITPVDVEPELVTKFLEAVAQGTKESMRYYTADSREPEDPKGRPIDFAVEIQQGEHHDNTVIRRGEPVINDGVSFNISEVWIPQNPTPTPEGLITIQHFNYLTDRGLNAEQVKAETVNSLRRATRVLKAAQAGQSPTA